MKTVLALTKPGTEGLQCGVKDIPHKIKQKSWRKHLNWGGPPCNKSHWRPSVRNAWVRPAIFARRSPSPKITWRTYKILVRIGCIPEISSVAARDSHWRPLVRNIAAEAWKTIKLHKHMHNRYKHNAKTIRPMLLKISEQIIRSLYEHPTEMLQHMLQRLQKSL